MTPSDSVKKYIAIHFKFCILSTIYHQKPGHHWWVLMVASAFFNIGFVACGHHGMNYNTNIPSNKEMPVIVQHLLLITSHAFNMGHDICSLQQSHLSFVSIKNLFSTNMNNTKMFKTTANDQQLPVITRHAISTEWHLFPSIQQWICHSFSSRYLQNLQLINNSPKLTIIGRQDITVERDICSL